MKKTIALFVALASFSCSKAQKNEFSKVALAEKVISMDGSEVSFESVLDKYKGKTVVLEFRAKEALISHCLTSCCQPCTTITIARVSNSQ